MAKKSAPENNLASLCELFDMLSDATRMRIVLILANGERNVGSLCDELKMQQPTVSHHLGLLRMNRVLTKKRVGKQVFYALEANAKGAAAKLKISLPPYNLTIDR